MKSALVVAVGLFILGVLLGLAQLWFTPWSVDVFFKLEMSVGGVLLIVGGVWFAVKESRSSKALRRGDLDG
jgi:hypothetical protein